MHADYCTWCLVAREIVNDGVSPLEFIQIQKGHSIINLPIIIVLKAKSTDQRTQKSLFP